MKKTDQLEIKKTLGTLGAQKDENSLSQHDVKNEQLWEKNEKRPKNTNVQTKGKRWDSDEQEVYLNFVIENPHLFLDERTRRSQRVFDKLSKMLNSNRTSEQCRTHHQKMRKKVEGEQMEQIIKLLIERREKKRKNKAKKETKTKKILIGRKHLRGKGRLRLERKDKIKSPLFLTIEFKDNIQFMKW